MSFLGDTMPDRSSHQGLPDEWNHGSHAARGSFPADGYDAAPGPADGYGAAPAGSHRARPADGYGSGPADGYGSGPADGYGTGSADGYGTGSADGYGAAPGEALGARTDSIGVRDDSLVTWADSLGTSADSLGTRADSFGAGTADAFGVRPAGTYGTGAADPFGEAGSFGSKNGDPFGPGSTASFSAVGADAGTARSEAAERSASAHRDLAFGDAGDSKGFLGALFDFGFTSFVTPKVIKVLYMLIVIGTVVSALVVTIVVFKASVMFGFLMLVFGDPLFILIALAIYRVILEFFVVTFRVAEDIRVLRERGSLS
jgi:hypothetical protein